VGEVPEADSFPCRPSLPGLTVGGMGPPNTTSAMRLDGFWYIGDDHIANYGPVRGAGRPRGPGITIGDDEAGNILLCFDGRWIMGGWH